MSDVRKKILLGNVGPVRMCKRILKSQTSSTAEIPFYKISTFGSIPDTFIDKAVYDEFRAKYSFPRKGDVLISAAGTVGKTVIYDGSPAYFQDSNIVWIENDESQILNKYLYYFYQTKPWLTTNGSTIKRIYNDDLRSIKVSFPDIHLQHKITTVLNDLDSKIDLNNKINAELEAMTKLIYDYWFVQFDFPDKNGRPYKSSGGKMAWNSDLKRKIPEGWQVGTLDSVLSLEYGKPLKETNRSGAGSPVVGSNGIVGYHSEYLVSGPGIVVGRKGSAGEIKWINENFYPIDTTYYVRDNYGLDNLIYHFFLLRSLNLKQVESSSTVPGINRNVVHNQKCTLPPKKLITSFHQLVGSNFAFQAKILVENSYLVGLRDWLLPMLMNGQVKLKDN